MQVSQRSAKVLSFKKKKKGIRGRLTNEPKLLCFVVEATTKEKKDGLEGNWKYL